MSTQTKHTPGPWIRRRDVDNSPQDSEEMKANARLIAAAPDMLAALMELCADKYLADPINADRMAKARAAIAKAEGTK